MKSAQTKDCNGEVLAAASTTKKKPPPPSAVPEPSPFMSADNTMNLALMDPPRWGWTAAGGIVDLLPPHEVRYKDLLWLFCAKIISFPSFVY